MKSLGKFPDPFLAEILGQGEAMVRAADGLAEQAPALDRIREAAWERAIVFTGMGGSYAACYAPVTALAGRGAPVSMADAAELLHFRRASLGPGTLVVMVTQSGRSAEVLRLAEELASLPARPAMASVTNGLDNPLAGIADVALDTRAGEERGPSTVTFAAALIILAAVARVLGGTESTTDVVSSVRREASRAAEAFRRRLAGHERRARELRAWLGERSVVTLLGRGAARASAEMGALLMKETARFAAEAIETGQFRHGPVELAGPEFAAVVFATERETRSIDLRLVGELLPAGAGVLVVTTDSGEAPPGALGEPIGPVDRMLAPAVALVPVQLLAWQLAAERGFDPGHLAIATKVTTRE